jgi:hypothetical protein
MEYRPLKLHRWRQIVQAQERELVEGQAMTTPDCSIVEVEGHLPMTGVCCRALAQVEEACCFRSHFCWEEPGPLEAAVWHEPV